MDLSTIKKKMDSLQYDSVQSWLADLRLMLANALRYNRPKDVVYKLALDVGRVLEAKVERDDVLQAHKRRWEVEHSTPADEPVVRVRVAEGWSVPPPINHTVVRRMRARLRAAGQTASSATKSSLNPGLAAATEQRDRRTAPNHTKTSATWYDGGVSEREAAAAREEKIWRKECARALMRLWKHKDAWPFMEPVDPVALQIPTYFDIIKNPMDLGTIKTKLHNASYTRADDFARDMRVRVGLCVCVCVRARALWAAAESIKGPLFGGAAGV